MSFAIATATAAAFTANAPAPAIAMPSTLSPPDYADYLIHHVSNLDVQSPASTQAVIALLALFPTQQCPSPTFLTLATNNPDRVVPELRKCRGYLKGEWQDIAAGRVKALVFLGRGGECRTRGDLESEKVELHKAYEAYEGCLTAYLRHLNALPQSVSSRPFLPILEQLLLDLRQLAVLADTARQAAITTTTQDAQDRSQGSQPHLEATARQLNKAFTVCVADRNSNMNNSRKWATYQIVNLLFRTYFKLKSLPLCRNILRALSASPLPPFEEFPASDRVTFRYYTGTLHFLSQEWSLALTDLQYAWDNVHQSAVKQQYLILLYLLPLLLILQGKLPALDHIWSVHPQLQTLYEPLFNSIRGTDSNPGPSLSLFHSTLSTPHVEKFLVQKGLFAAVEAFRPILLQAILKKLYLVKDKSTRLTLQDVEKALVFAGYTKQDEEEEEDEEDARQDCEWLVAGLIAKGFVKGYLSHERQMLVLSNLEPFPGIAKIGVGVAM